MNRPRLLLPLLAFLALEPSSASRAAAVFATRPRALATLEDCRALLRVATDDKKSLSEREEAVRKLDSAPVVQSGGDERPYACASLTEIFEGLARIYLDEEEFPSLRSEAVYAIDDELDGADSIEELRALPKNPRPAGSSRRRLSPFLASLHSPNERVVLHSASILSRHFKLLLPAERKAVEDKLAREFLLILANPNESPEEREWAADRLRVCDLKHGPCYLARPEVRRALWAVLADREGNAQVRRVAAGESASDFLPLHRLPFPTWPEEARTLARLLEDETDPTVAQSLAMGLAFGLVEKTPSGQAPDAEIARSLAAFLGREGPLLYSARYHALFGLLHASHRSEPYLDRDLAPPGVPPFPDTTRWQRDAFMNSLPPLQGGIHLPELDPVFPSSLARIVSSDNVAAMRWLAARLAGLFKEPEPKLEAALKHAAEEDSDEDVRAAARIAKTRRALAAASGQLAETLADGLPMPR